jgi:hypothetical protein
MESGGDYFNNPNTIFNKAAWFDKDCAKISAHVKTKHHSIGWDGKKYIVFIHSSLVWLWHRYITGRFKDTASITYEKRPAEKLT